MYGDAVKLNKHMNRYLSDVCFDEPDWIIKDKLGETREVTKHMDIS